MTPQFQERHQDYVLRSLSLAPGQVVTVTLPLDLDAPFVLRSRAALCTLTQAAAGLETLSFYDLRYLKMSFTGPDENYVSRGRVPFGLQAPYYGLLGNPAPVFPQLVYPAGGVISVDLENAGASAINNLRVYFRGVKLFPWGARPVNTYPANYGRILPYAYPFVFAGLGVSEIRRNVPFLVNPPGSSQAVGDFALRGGQAGTPYCVATGYIPVSTGNLPSAHEVSVIIRDSDGKAYSNDWVHVDALFGQSSLLEAENSASGHWFALASLTYGIAGFMVGPSNPGLFYPEIYIPSNGALFFDVKRDDSAELVTQAAVDFPIVLMGAKVMPQ